MESRDIYEIWAPTGGPWSPWAKPVLFAHLTPAKGLPPVEVPGVWLNEEPGWPTGTTIVVDLPGLQSVGLGLDLARLGFRPVPLFNGCPSPDFLGLPGDEVVATGPIIAALFQGTDRLASAALPIDAPPAFLLDEDRLGTGRQVLPHMFDNRWVVFSTDFPSASYLLERGIVKVQVVHRGRLLDDLSDALRLWQHEGITLSEIDLESSGASAPLNLPRTWRMGFARVLRRLWSWFSLRRNPGGGFGGVVPEAGSSGG